MLIFVRPYSLLTTLAFVSAYSLASFSSQSYNFHVSCWNLAPKLTNVGFQLLALFLARAPALSPSLETLPCHSSADLSSTVVGTIWYPIRYSIAETQSLIEEINFWHQVNSCVFLKLCSTLKAKLAFLLATESFSLTYLLLLSFSIFQIPNPKYSARA